MGAVAAIAIRDALGCAAILLALPITACSSAADKPSGDNIAIVTGATTAAHTVPAAARPTPLPTVTPMPTPTSFADMRPHKSFTDPPLPPELRAHVPPAANANGASTTH